MNVVDLFSTPVYVKNLKPLSKAVVKKIYAYETKEDWQFKFYKVKIPTYLMKYF